MEQQAGGQEPDAGGEGNEMVALLQNLTTGLEMLRETINDAGVAPQLAEKLNAISGMFDEVVNEIGGQPAGDPSGAASPEAGGNPNARPMNPGMK